MSKKCANDEKNNTMKQNKTGADNEYNPLFDHNNPRKRSCRKSYVHNCGDVMSLNGAFTP